MKKWHVGVAFICTSVLLSFSATVQADTHLDGKIQNVNQQEGSYEVVIDADDDKGVTDVYVPTWSAPDQSDIVWYKAQKRSDGNYITRVNAKNHKNHRGIYISHVYAYNQKGKFQAKNLGKTKLNEVVSAEIKNINLKAGTYDVVVKDHIGGAVDNVKVPIWSTPNQSDLVWYPAQKQADGTWVVHMNIKNHKYHTGKYTTHVYMYTKNQGIHAINIGQTAIQGIKDQLNANVTNVNQQNGTYDVMIHATSQAGIREVYVPTWSAPDQSDIVWYKATKQSDGNYSIRINARNHKNHRGTYISHVYAYSNSGNVTAINAGKTKLNEVVSAEIKNINSKAGTYDVVVKDQIGGAVDNVKVPIWSTPNQSDLVWYPAQKQADGTWVVHMNIKNHKYHTGKYTTHVYMYTKNQGVHAINIGQTAIQGIKDQLSADIKNVNPQNGTYDIVVNASSQFGIREVKVPIWSAPNQSDLVWYKAQKQADGSYVVHMNIKNHKNHRGTYMTHVYMYNNRGQQTAIALNNTNLPVIPDTLKAQVKNVNKEAGSYDVIIQAASQQGIDRVEVPTWSMKNQSDLVWYKAQKQADGSYIVHMNIKNHKNHRGNYTSHVYLWHPDGSNTAISLGETDLIKPTQEQPKPTEEPGKSDNNQQGNTDTGNITEPSKPTEQPGKTEEPQARELDVEKIKSEVFRLTNLERTKRGINALIYDKKLDVVTDLRAQESAVKYAHIRPNNTIFSTAITELLPEYKNYKVSASEILAGASDQGYKNEDEIANDLVSSWLNSPPHKEAMLIQNMKTGTVGIFRQKSKEGIGNIYYGVQIFLTEKENVDNNSITNNSGKMYVNEDGNVEIPLN